LQGSSLEDYIETLVVTVLFLEIENNVQNLELNSGRNG